MRGGEGTGCGVGGAGVELDGFGDESPKNEANVFAVFDAFSAIEGPLDKEEGAPKDDKVCDSWVVGLLVVVAGGVKEKELLGEPNPEKPPNFGCGVDGACQ